MISDLYMTLTGVIKSNPVMAGAFSLYGLGIITYLCKNVPSTIFKLISTHCIITLTLNNDIKGCCFENFTSCRNWVFSKVLRLRHVTYDTSMIFNESIPPKELMPKCLQPSYGTHYFFFKGHLCWFTVRKTESSAVKYQKIDATISVLFGTIDLLKEAIEEFGYVREGSPSLWVFDGNTWCGCRGLTPRDLNTVIVANGVKEKIISKIDTFLASKEAYARRGQPWKLCILIHGVPGTGKTSLIRGIADKYQRSLMFLNLGTTYGPMIDQALNGVDNGRFLILEEIDCASSTTRRKGVSKPGDDEAVNPQQSFIERNEKAFAEADLSALLNSLDGLMTPDGLIAIATTNHIEKLDPALIRKGRFDLVIEVGKLGHTEVVEYIKTAFPEATIPTGRFFKPILGCDIQDLLIDNQEDPDAFIESIPHEPKQLTACQ